MMAGGKEDPKDGMNFMYAAPPGLKEVQEREEAEKARRQQLDNVGLGAERERFLANVANAPTDGAFAAGKTNDVHVQPFGVDPKDVREAQKANRKLGEGKMAGQDNPFVSHRSTAMDNVKLKDQEWAVQGDYVTEDYGAAPAADSEAAYLASLSKKDRKLLAKYTKKLQGGGAEGAIGKDRKKRKKEKKERRKKEKRKKHKKKHKKRASSSSSSSS